MDKISAEFAAALIKATSLIEGAVKDSVNPHFKSRYADLAAVIAAVKTPLFDNGIAFFQRLIPSDRVDIETVLIYKTGEVLSMGTISLPVDKQTPQGMGSAISYARRYALACALGVPQIDDDGNEASHPKPKQKFLYHIPTLTPEQREYFSEHAIRGDKHGFYELSFSLGERAESMRRTEAFRENFIKEKDAK